MTEMYVDVINFGMTNNLVFNYVLDVTLTFAVKGLLPFYLLNLVIDRGLKWST